MNCCRSKRICRRASKTHKIKAITTKAQENSHWLPPWPNSTRKSDIQNKARPLSIHLEAPSLERCKWPLVHQRTTKNRGKWLLMPRHLHQMGEKDMVTLSTITTRIRPRKLKSWCIKICSRCHLTQIIKDRMNSWEQQTMRRLPISNSVWISMIMETQKMRSWISKWASSIRNRRRCRRTRGISSRHLLRHHSIGKLSFSTTNKALVASAARQLQLPSSLKQNNSRIWRTSRMQINKWTIPIPTWCKIK